MNFRTALLLLTTSMLLSHSPSVYSQSSSASQAIVVRSISIYDSPAMGDTGNHSIIGGLLTGKGLTAILPNLQVCVRPKDAGLDSQVCTRVCKPSHQCLNQPFPGHGLALGSNRILTVHVRDVNGPNSQAIATFDEVPANCDSDHRCIHDAAGGPVVISFGTSTPPPPAPNDLNDIAPAAGPTNTTASSPPANCKVPSLRWTAQDQNPLSGLHGPYASVQEAVVKDAAGYFAWKRGRNRAFFQSAEWGFVIVRDRRDKTKYYTTPPAPSSAESQWWNPLGPPPLLQWADYITSLGKAFDGSCADIKDFTIAADVHTHPLPDVWGQKRPFVDNFSMRDFQQAIRLKTNDYRPDLTERIPIGSSVYPIETRNLVPDLEKIFMINERDSQVYMFEPQRTDMNIQDQDIVDDKSRVIYNDIWNGYSNPSRVRDQYLRCRPENPWAIPNIKKSISNQLQSFGQMLPAPVRSWFGIP